MKIPTLLLAGSLAVNAALVVAVVRPSMSSGPVSAAEKTAADQAKAGATPGGVGGIHNPAASGDGWNRVQTDDLHALVARLRLAGFPDAVLRAVVGERVKEQFAAKRAAIVGDAKGFQFWKPGNAMINIYGGDPKQRSALRDLAKEQSTMMKTLLGPNPTVDDELTKMLQRRQYGDLPKEKTAQLAQITQDYNDLATQVRNEASDLMLADDRAKLAYLEKEKLADLATLLSPGELEDYQMRASNTAVRLRSQLAGLDLTEDQYRAIYRFQAPVDEKYNNTQGSGMFTYNGGGPPSSRQLAQNDVVAQVKAVLGEPLGTQYEHAIDPNYQVLSQLTTRLNLPSDSIDHVLGVQKDFEERAQALRQNRTLAPADRQQQLAALGQEASQKVSTALGGARGLEAYRQNGGYWLQNYTPSPAINR